LVVCEINAAGDVDKTSEISVSRKNRIDN
jgi:hypothetical protein